MEGSSSHGMARRWGTCSSGAMLLVVSLALLAPLGICSTESKYLAVNVQNATRRFVSGGKHQGAVAVLQAALAEVLVPDKLGATLKEMADADPFDSYLQTCYIDTGIWLKGLYDRETWALQMVDSTSKLVTGVLYGSFIDMGNFDECVASDAASSSGTFTGRYFLPAYDVNTYDPESKSWSKLLTLRSSLCLPSTCSSAKVKELLRKGVASLDTTLTPLGIKVDVRLPPEFTSTAAARREMTGGDVTVIVICVLLLAAGLLATAIDLAVPEASRDGCLGFLLAFSLYSNGRGLLKQSKPGPGNISCLSGIRTLSIMWVVVGHRYKWALDAPFTNLKAMYPLVQRYSSMLIAGAPLAVDTFFAMGGLLVCFVTLRSLEKTRYFNVPHFYFHRYLRLTPAFVIVIAIQATWIELIGNGPMWYDLLMVEAERCRTYWWSNMLYISNYYSPLELCLGHSWYLMVDMQLYWITPLILVPLWRWPRIGMVWLAMVTVVSCIVPFTVAWVNEIRAHLPLDFDATLFRREMALQYTPTHMRGPAYFVGIAAGYLLYLERKGSVKVKLSQAKVLLGWALSATLCLAVLLGAQPILDKDDVPYDRTASSMFIGFHRFAWGLGISWIILACSWGYGGIVNKFLSCYPFQVLGRLTYSMYLVHVVVQTADFGAMRTPKYYSDYDMFHDALGDYAVSLGFALLLCLLAESPILLIEKKLTGGGKPRREAKAEITAAASSTAPSVSVDVGGDATPAKQPA